MSNYYKFTNLTVIEKSGIHTHTHLYFVCLKLKFHPNRMMPLQLSWSHSLPPLDSLLLPSHHSVHTSLAMNALISLPFHSFHPSISGASPEAHRSDGGGPSQTSVLQRPHLPCQLHLGQQWWGDLPVSWRPPHQHVAPGHHRSQLQYPFSTGQG